MHSFYVAFSMRTSPSNNRAADGDLIKTSGVGDQRSLISQARFLLEKVDFLTIYMCNQVSN